MQYVAERVAGKGIILVVWRDRYHPIYTLRSGWLTPPVSGHTQVIYKGITILTAVEPPVCKIWLYTHPLSVHSFVSTDYWGTFTTKTPSDQSKKKIHYLTNWNNNKILSQTSKELIFLLSEEPIGFKVFRVLSACFNSLDFLSKTNS